MQLNSIKSHIIMLCVVLLLGLASGPALAVIHTITNSNFTFLDPNGFPVGSADDVFGTFDDSRLCSDVTCTRTGSMTLESNTPFFGFL